MYTIEKIAQAETYKADKNLFGLARRIAEAKLEAESRAMFAKKEKIRNALETLKLPDGVQISGNSDTEIFIKVPWDGGDLAKRFDRIGGRWCREEKCFSVPIDSAPSLQRVLNNWRKSQNESQATATEQQQRLAAAKAKACADQQSAWAEEKRQRSASYAAEIQAQKKSTSERVLVIAGAYKVGDILKGKRIAGFGKQWTEGDLARGQLYQPCEWGNCPGEPVCVVCSYCRKHCKCGTQTTYCYAYFS